MNWIILALLSAFFAALVSIFGKIGLEKLDTTLATTIRSGIMFGVLLLFSLFTNTFQNLKQVDLKALGILALAGISGAISWLFYFSALKKGPASGVASLDRLSLVFVFFLAIIFLGENLTIKTFIGTVFMIAGILLFTL